MFDFLNRTKLYSRNRQYHRSSLLGFPIVYSISRTQKRRKQNFWWPVNPWHFYKEIVWRNEALYRKVITCFILVPWTFHFYQPPKCKSTAQLRPARSTRCSYKYCGLTEGTMVPCRFLSLLNLIMLFHCLKTSGGSCEMNEPHLTRGKQNKRFFLLFKSEKWISKKTLCNSTVLILFEVYFL